MNLEGGGTLVADCVPATVVTVKSAWLDAPGEGGMGTLEGEGGTRLVEVLDDGGTVCAADSAKSWWKASNRAALRILRERAPATITRGNGYTSGQIPSDNGSQWETTGAVSARARQIRMLCPRCQPPYLLTSTESISTDILLVG